MQTEQDNGPLPVPYIPNHLLGIAEDASSATVDDLDSLPTTPISIIRIPSDPTGIIRGAVYCLPVALMMWAIIIAALLHFLSM